MTRLLAILCLLVSLGWPATARDREMIGRGWLLTNDILGDTHDRWRSGSFAASGVWGPAWSGAAPEGFGQVLEFRFGSEIITPENPSRPAPGDRPFAGMVSFGLHTHFERGGIDYAVGADIVLTGPMTGLDDLQKTLHLVTGGRDPSAPVRAAQVANDVNPTLVIEAGRDVALGRNARLRPFAEGRWGYETLFRVGADLTIGGLGQGGLMARAPVSGHRYLIGGPRRPGFSYVLGADIAYVEHSEVLSSARGYRLTDARSRVRAGMNWHLSEGSGLFYGLTWLDKEFRGQREAQIVGSLRLDLKF